MSLSGKLLLGFLGVLLGCATIFSVYFGLQSFREYGCFNDREHVTQARLDDLQQTVTSQNAYLTALQGDKEFQKHVIREKLGYAYPGERILHFTH